MLTYTHTWAHTHMDYHTLTYGLTHLHKGSHMLTHRFTQLHTFICAHTQAQTCSTLTYTHAYACMHIYNHTCAPMPTYAHVPIQSQCAGMITHVLTKIQHMAPRLILSHSHMCMLTHTLTYNHTYFRASLTCLHTLPHMCAHTPSR